MENLSPIKNKQTKKPTKRVQNFDSIACSLNNKNLLVPWIILNEYFMISIFSHI